MSKISDVNETSLIPYKLNSINDTSVKGIEIDSNGITLKKDLNTIPKNFSINQDGFNFNNEYTLPFEKLKDIDKRVFKYDKFYKPFTDFVRCFYEFTNEQDFMYDYSGNGFNLTNIGSLYTENGANFQLNNDVRYRTQFQEDMRRIELRGDKLNELFSPITNQFSITFDFTPLEYDCTLIQFRDTNLSATSFTLKLTDTGTIYLVIAVAGVVIFSASTIVAVSLNKPHHFCFNSNGTQSRAYIDNTSFGFTNTVIDLNNYVFDALTIGCSKDRNSDRYSYPYAGLISNLLITSGSLDDTLRTKIYNGDYGYDIIMLAGQSNMVGVAPIQQGFDNNYSEIENIVYQYDFNTNSVIPATNQLKHYNTTFMNTGVSQYFNNMGGWLDFVKHYIKYYKKSSRRKVLLIPCGLGGSSFALDWRPGLRMANYLIANTNICTGYSKLNKINSMIWYEGESEAFTSNASLPIDLENLRTNLITNVNGFNADTPMILTLINNKYDIDNTILGVPANQFVNNTISNFAKTYGYGVVKTDDLKLLSDWIHLNAESLRKVGKRWFDSLCDITNIDNRSYPIIKTMDKTQFNEIAVENLNVKNLDVLHNKEYDIDVENYLPIGKAVNPTTSIPTRSCKAFYQPKTDEIWLIPIASLLTFKYFNVKTKKLIERTDWDPIISTGMACCMYKDILYVLDSNHRDTWVQGEIMPETVLYIIDTLNYTFEKITNFAVKTSGIGVDWVVPADSSSNLSKTVIQTVSYASMFGYNDKLYFIPYAQQDVGVFDLKTKTFNQTTYALGYVGGFFGSVYNADTKCLYFARSYKVGAAAGWDIPYLNFTNSPPTLESVLLPSNYVGFRSGVYCPTNGSVYIPMGATNNGVDAYVLKINSSNSPSSLTFGGITANKQLNAGLFSPDNRVILNGAGVLYRIKPEDDSLDTNITITGGRFIQCYDKYGVLYSFSNAESSSYGTYKMPITINNKEIFNPTFNCFR